MKYDGWNGGGCRNETRGYRNDAREALPAPHSYTPSGKDEMGHANETMRGNRSKTREANSRLTPVPSPREGRNDDDGENEVKEGDKKETTRTTKMKVKTTKRRRQLNDPGQY